MRNTYDIRDFSFSRVGPYTGPPQRLILHTDGNPNEHSGLSSLQWGERENAFTIQWYIDGKVAYRAIPEDRQAYHVLEKRIAVQKGYPAPNGRGDYRAVGWEHKMEADGSWSQETRITSVLLGRDTMLRWPHLIDEVSEHATWDPWTRANDVGNALYIPDWVVDVKDLVAGREPWRTVGPTASAEPATGGPQEDEMRLFDFSVMAPSGKPYTHEEIQIRRLFALNNAANVVLRADTDDDFGREINDYDAAILEDVLARRKP